MEVIEQKHYLQRNVNYWEILSSLEAYGRTAYKSEDKITPESCEKFIKSIIDRGHESVLEHANLTVKFITDRGVTHELVRHRLCAYTQESTRYCNYSKKGMTFIKPVFWYHIGHDYDLYLVHWNYIMQECEKYIIILLPMELNQNMQEQYYLTA